MTFNFEVTIADIIAGISLIFIIAGGIFTCVQWHLSVLLKRAGYINELTEKIRTDPFISDAVYLLDYGQSWYSNEFHSSGKMELKIDKTLSYFSYICYLRKQRIISNKEYKFFKYEIERILLNPDIQDYFYNLYHFSKKFKVPFTFHYLFEYGKKHNLFDKEFFNPTVYKNTSKYHKYLNF